MEEKVDVYCKVNNNRRRDLRYWLITAIVAVILAFFVGLLVAATTGVLTTLGTAVIISLVIILSVLLLIGIISILYRRLND